MIISIKTILISVVSFYAFFYSTMFLYKQVKKFKEKSYQEKNLEKRKNLENEDALNYFVN